MSSEVEICNLALSHLGDSATVASIDPPEGSAQAEHCARWYPVARNALLEMHDWSFATRRVVLAELVRNDTAWRHAYARPADALKILAVLPSGATDDSAACPFDTETDAADNDIIMCDQAGAIARYTRIVTDSSRFSPLFVTTLGWFLSTYLAGPVLKGDSAVKIANANMSKAMAFLTQARLSDANQKRGKPLPHTAPWIGVR